MSLEISAETTFLLDLTNQPYVSQYQSVYNAMTTKPSAYVADNQNTMVSTLVDNGVWGKLDVFYLFAQEFNSSSEALLNWKDPATNNATAISSPAWVSLEGYSGDGGADYVNTNFNPNTEGVNYVQNSACMGVYIRTNVQENGVDVGCGDGSHTCFMYARYTDDTVIGRINAGGGPTPANADSRGLFVVNRSASNLTTIYKNGSALSPTNSTASTGVPNEDFFVLANNTSGTPSLYSTKQISCSFMGGSLSASEQSDLKDAIETYMDSNGKGVIT